MLENLKKLKIDMMSKKWTISSFLFSYKRIDYIVLVKLFVKDELKRDKFALVKLHFIQLKNLNNNLEVEANTQGLLTEAKIIRIFFGIEYSENLGKILKEFASYLNKSIPIEMNNSISDIEKTAMIISLSKSDSENPNKIYCYKVMRNPEGKQRSLFNADKTKLLYMDLFKYFENDSSISFCYTEDKEKEKSISEIIYNFTTNNSK